MNTYKVPTGVDVDQEHLSFKLINELEMSWILLTFLGIFGIHRFYLGKWLTGLVWLLTGGLFLLGWLYDLWTLNEQVDEVNRDDA